MTQQGEHDVQQRVPGWAVVAFVGLAMALAWLVVLPLWVGGRGLGAPFAGLLLPVMMFTPLVSAGIVLLVLGRRRPRPVLRFLGVWPIRPARRTVWVTVAAYLAAVLFPLLTVVIAAAAGWLRLDLAHFSGFRQTLEAAGAGDLGDAVPTLVVVQLVTLPFLGVLNVFATLGEEIGWRGFLVPALRQWGRWPALVGSGVVWGLWHAPIILLGYDFGRTDWIGVLDMVVACALLGVVFGWLRLRTGSVWPAVFAHAGLNAAAAVGALVADAGVSISHVLRNPLGLPGWIVLAVVIVVLVLTGAVRRESGLAPARQPVSAADTRMGA